MAIPSKGRGSAKGHGTNSVKKGAPQPTKGGAFNPAMARTNKGNRPR
jgi:hypothetical protein